MDVLEEEAEEDDPPVALEERELFFFFFVEERGKREEELRLSFFLFSRRSRSSERAYFGVDENKCLSYLYSILVHEPVPESAQGREH